MNETSEEKMKLLGNMGEKIVSNYLTEQGYKVIHAINPYNNSLDIFVDGGLCEIKTQVPWIKENSFTFETKQLKKCQEVKYLFFVAAIGPREDPLGGYISLVDPKRFEYREKITSDGKNMILINRNQPGIIKHLHLLDNDTIKLMRKYIQ